MKIIGITGSLASGKTTASKILSFGKGPLFSADKYVKKLYKQNDFKKKIYKKFNLKKKSNVKKDLKKKILSNHSNLKKLEKIIHPLVRLEMKKFIKKNENEKFVFLEIPLLIESKLSKNFDVIIFIKSNKNVRLGRFIQKGGSAKLFDVLDSQQLSDQKKSKFCHHTILNDKNKKFLKKKLLYIFKQYE